MRAGLLLVPWILLVGCASSPPTEASPAPSPAAPSPPAATVPPRSSSDVATPAPAPAWRKTAPMPRERMGFDAVLLGDGMVLVVGNDGNPWADDYYASGAEPGSELVDLYDPAAGSWSPAEGLNKPRKWGAALALPDGSGMVLGGVNANGQPFSSTKIFSPVTLRWAPGPEMIVARREPVAVTLGDGRVLVAGTGADLSTGTSEVYDPATAGWTGQARLPVRYPRLHTLLRLGDAGALAIGSYETGDTDNFGDVGFVYIAASNRWTQVDFPWVFGASLIALDDGDVLAVGGGGGGDCCRGIASVSDVYRFDHETLKWREVASLPSPREAIALAILPDGRVLATGGVRVRESDAGGDGTPVKVTETYDPATDTWSKGPDLLEPSGGAIAVALANGDALLLGGSLSAPERLTVGP